MPDALMVSSSFLPGRGGIESYLAELCSELAPRLAVLAPATRGREPIPAGLGYPAEGYPGSMLVPSKAVARAIEEACARHGTEKVLFGTPWPLALLGPRLKASGLRYAVIAHGAEVFVPAAIPVLRGRLKRALAGADLLLPVSHYTESKIAALLGRGPRPESAVLYARVDVDRFRPDAAQEATRAGFGLSETDRVLLCFGRVVRRKGVHRAIDALADIRAAVPEARLVVAGTGPQLASLRRRARGDDRVTFLGRVPEDDAAALYATSDVFVFPVVDRWRGLEVEGLGVVLVEASACGTPSVTGRSGGTPEAVPDGVAGFVIDAHDRSALVRSVTTLLQDDEKRAAMGLAARRHVTTTFADRKIPTPLSRWLG